MKKLKISLSSWDKYEPEIIYNGFYINYILDIFSPLYSQIDYVLTCLRVFVYA